MRRRETFIDPHGYFSLTRRLLIVALFLFAAVCVAFAVLFWPSGGA